MARPAAVLIFDRQVLARESLTNYLLAAGYSNIHASASIRAALAELRRERFSVILLGVSPPFLAVKRLAKVARGRHPDAQIFLLVAARDRSRFADAPIEVLLKEFQYAQLLECLGCQTL